MDFFRGNDPKDWDPESIYRHYSDRYPEKERSQLLQAIKKDLELASLEESAHGHAASRLVKNWRIVSVKKLKHWYS